jgi:DNA topoisomerase-3
LTSNKNGRKPQENRDGSKKDTGKKKESEEKKDTGNKNESAKKKDSGKNEPGKQKKDTGKSDKPVDKQGKKKGTNNKSSEEQNDKKAKSTTPLAPSIPPNQPQQTNDINYSKGERITVLHIAEKPSIGKAIANGLASGSIKSGGKMLAVHEFTDPPFPNAPKASKCVHKVTSVAGHVFSVDFPPQFQSWDSVDPAELFDAPVVKKPNKGSMIKHLQDEARGVDFIVLWMDCDRYVVTIRCSQS